MAGLLCRVAMVGITIREDEMKNKPKLDGSGKGKRANRGRGGCKVTKPKGQGQNPKKQGE